ncbi:hypothetical protein LTR02_012821 [Friedmanniomyces endolithicus]|nr:hypothetical protein LTR02_012821 [Friedmanniomyces endolithicus]
MADMENEEDLFADLARAGADQSRTAERLRHPRAAPKDEPNGDDFNVKTEYDDGNQQYGNAMQGVDHTGQSGGYGDGGQGRHHSEDRDRPIHIKDDG